MKRRIDKRKSYVRLVAVILAALLVLGTLSSLLFHFLFNAANKLKLPYAPVFS